MLTFKELMAWLEQRSIDLATCEESDFDEGPVHDAQLYPLPGGSIKTAEIEDDGLSRRIVRIDGMHDVKEIPRLHPQGREIHPSGTALLQPGLHQRAGDGDR